MNEADAKAQVEDILANRLVANAVTALVADDTPATRESVRSFIEVVRLVRQPSDDPKHEQLAKRVTDRLISEIEQGDWDDRIIEAREAI